MESFNFPSRPKKSQEDTDRAFAAALEEMLAVNETISARALAARLDVSGLGHASSITRDDWRNSLLKRFKARQDEVRRLIERNDHTSKTNLVAQLEKANGRIAELQAQVDILTASHRAMIHAVGEVGGMRAWQRFFSGYQEVADRLRNMRALQTASVTPLPARQSEEL